jgi:phosphatidylglycerophosphatase C
LTFFDPPIDHKRFRAPGGRESVKRVNQDIQNGGVANDKMGASEGSRQGPVPSAAIVAFDFDGTLTAEDSFGAFLRWRAGPLAYAVRMAAIAPAILAYLVDRDRGRLKVAAARAGLGRLSRNEIEQLAARFAEARWDRLMRPDALAAWRRWRERGALLVIVTASPESLVAPFARRLGADRLIGSRLAFDADGRLAARLDGENCRGPEKVRRLREAFGEDVRLAAAYGDTDGDREMLQIAEARGYRVFRERPQLSRG